MSKHVTTHKEQIEYLKKIEGQMRGIQKMIEDERYCVDILIQIQSAEGALQRIYQDIFKKHLEGCVAHALTEPSEANKIKKIDEIVNLVARARNGI